MATFGELLKASSGLGNNVAVGTHLKNLGSGGGGGLPFPVPVQMVGVENLSMVEAQSTQITQQTPADGIEKQTPAAQIDLNTGNEGL